MKKVLIAALVLLGCAKAFADTFPGSPYGSSSGSSSGGGGGTVTSVTASSPLSSSGGNTPNITITSPLPVANGGTATSTAFTAGSVVFSTSSGVYFQDNANFFYDATNHRLGLGNTTPAVTLDLRNKAIAFSSSTVNGVSYTWPGAQGASSTFLKNDGSGALTWATVPTTVPGGNPTDIQFNTGGAFDATDNFQFTTVSNSNTVTLNSGNGTGSGLVSRLWLIGNDNGGGNGLIILQASPNTSNPGGVNRIIWAGSNGGGNLWTDKGITANHWINNVNSDGGGRQWYVQNFGIAGSPFPIWMTNTDKGFGIYNTSPATDTFDIGIDSIEESTMTVVGMFKNGYEQITNACGAGVTTCTATCSSGKQATGCGVCSVAAVTGLSVDTGGSSTQNSCTCTSLTVTTISASVYCARTN